jgi:hypothetical protein
MMAVVVFVVLLVYFQAIESFTAKLNLSFTNHALNGFKAVRRVVRNEIFDLF